MTLTSTPTEALPTPAPAPRPILRRWRLWAIASLILALAVGWALAFYNYDSSEANASSVVRLRGDNVDLKRELGSVTDERDKLVAGRADADAAMKSREDAAKKREDGLTAREAAAKQREEDVKAREDAVTQQEKVQAQNTITEGNWAVGVDVQPGTYRTKEPVTDHCYWGIYADANGSNIVANDIVTGGRPTVTIKNGQYFTTTRCGEWIKV
jgi:hypothetical protein